MPKSRSKSAGEIEGNHDALLSFLLSVADEPLGVELVANTADALLDIAAGDREADGAQETTKIAPTTALTLDRADGAMDANALQVVSLHPELLKHQHYPMNSTARQVVGILNGQICNGGLERSRGGKISRKLITKKLGLSETAMVSYLAILTDYEDATGGRESTVETKIPEMRTWFEASMADGSLEIRDGKVSRIQFYDRFGLAHSKTVLIRYPRVAAVVEEFDERVRVTGYTPSETASEARKLAALLAKDPPVDKDGRSINKAEIARLLDIPLYRLKRRPHLDAILEAERRLLTSLEQDPLVAFAGGRLFKFETLVEQGWSTAYVARIVAAFARHYGSKSKDRAKSHHAALIELLSFIAGNGSQVCRSVLHGLGNGAPVNSLVSEFTRALQEYRDHLRTIYENDASCNLKITTTNSIVRIFNSDSLLPTPSLYPIAFREDNKKHLQTVAEATDATVKVGVRQRVDDYIQFATAMLQQAADVRQIDLTSSETSEFTKVLRDELEGGQFSAAENPAVLISRVLGRRISLLKGAAWVKVEQGQQDLETGASLLSRSVDLGEDFDRVIAGTGMTRRFRDALMRRYFPVGENRDQGIANLLKLVERRYGRIYPANKLEGRLEGQFFQKRALEYGGAKKLQAYLLPAQEVVSAVLTLYLLESGSNVSVGRTLFVDCIEATEEPHHYKVTGYKARALGKPIFAIMEERCEAIKAMKWLATAVSNISDLDVETRNQLFVCNSLGARFKVIEEFSYRNDFKRLVQSIPELAHLSITPNMIRPSILLKAALEADGRTNLSLAIGQHGKVVHEGYVNRHPLRYLRDTEIRHFQHSLETVVVQAIKDAHDLLGVDVDGMTRRVEAVMKTGLGTLCAHRNGRPGNGGAPCTSLDCWNDCPQLIVIAKKEEVAILQVWQHSLRLVEGDWIRDQPERWEAVWLPWLCFIDAVEVKMRQSFGKVWRAASEISEKMISNPKFVPMRLF